MKVHIQLLLIVLFAIASQHAAQAQQSTLKKIDLLLKEADNLKYKSDSIGFLKVEEAKKLAVKLNNKAKLGEVYTMLGVYNYVKGSYNLSLQMYLKAVPIHEKYNNDKDLARSLNGIALIQSGFNQMDEAISTFEKCLQIDLKNKNYLGITRCYFNISLAQGALKAYDEATVSLQKALRYSKFLEGEESNNMIESKLGDMMLTRNKSDSALYYYNKVLTSKQPLPNNWEKAYAYIGLSQTFLELNDYDKAEEYGLLSYSYALKNTAIVDVARISKIISEVYYKKSDFKKAYDYRKISSDLEDSLYSEKKINDINYLQLKSKEVENLKLVSTNQKKVQEAKRNQIIMYSFVALILLLIGTLFLAWRTAKLKDAFNRKLTLKNEDIKRQKALIIRQNKDLLSLNESKNQLFSIISHDLRSPLNTIIQVLELQKEHAFSPELQEEVFEKLHLQAQSTSRMLNDLLEWANTQMDGQKVNFESVDIYSLIEHVADFYREEINEKQIKFQNFEQDQVLFINADIGQARIIIQNLISNAIKFTNPSGKISVSYTESDDYVEVHILNTGKKLSEERIDQILNRQQRMTSEDGTAFEEGTGLGLLLVKQFLANNRGRLDLKSTVENGTEFIISFLKN